MFVPSRHEFISLPFTAVPASEKFWPRAWDLSNMNSGDGIGTKRNIYPCFSLQQGKSCGLAQSTTPIRYRKLVASIRVRTSAFGNFYIHLNRSRRDGVGLKRPRNYQLIYPQSAAAPSISLKRSGHPTGIPAGSDFCPQVRLKGTHRWHQMVLIAISGRKLLGLIPWRTYND